MQLFLFDIPYIHYPAREESQNFFDALSNVDKEDLSIFESSGIKVLTKFVWPHIQKYIIRNQFVSYIFYLALYCIYAIYLYDYDQSAWATDTWYEAISHHVCSLILILYSIYMLYQEYFQLRKLGWDYFDSLWNILDFMPAILIILIIILDYTSISVEESVKDPTVEEQLEDPTQEAETNNFSEIWSLTFWLYFAQAITCLFMMLKIFYFLRIFRSTGFFVNMLISILQGSATFFILFTLIIIAFGVTFAILNFSDNPLIGVYYVYLLSLGEFDNDYSAFPISALLQLLFILATIFLMIVMFNILIAVISTIYENVIEVQELANDFERVNMITETILLLPLETRKAICADNKFLIVARNLNTTSSDTFAQKKKEKDE